MHNGNSTAPAGERADGIGSRAMPSFRRSPEKTRDSATAGICAQQEFAISLESVD